MKNNVFFKLLLFIILILLILTFSYFKKNKTVEIAIPEEEIYNSNIIKNINYVSEGANGTKYNINADEGETDLKYSDIIFLRNVKAIITTKASEKIFINSDFGKYNVINNDTIFSKNVIVNYLDNTINGEYLDYSSNRNTIIISKNVKYTYLDNIMKSDVIEMDILTRNIKIYMLDKKDKVNINNQ